MTVGSGGCSIPGQENILDTNITVTIPAPSGTPKGIDYWIKFNCTLSGGIMGPSVYAYGYITNNETRTKVVNSNIIEMHIHYCCLLKSSYEFAFKYPTSTLTYDSKVLPTLNGVNFYKAKFELFRENAQDTTQAYCATPTNCTPLEIELAGSISSGVMNIDTDDAIAKIQSLIATYDNMLQAQTGKPCYLVLKELVTN